MLMTLKSFARGRLPEKADAVNKLEIFFLIPELLYKAKVEYISEATKKTKIAYSEDFAEINEAVLNQFLNPFLSQVKEGEKIERLKLILDFNENTSLADLFILNSQGIKYKKTINTKL